MSNDRDNRAAARDRLRNLVVPVPVGRADRLRSRTPSPVNPGSFFPRTPATPASDQFFDASDQTASSAMATPEQLAALREQLRNEVRAEFRNEAAATAAQIPDAIRRKPEIPSFDKDHIEIWIKRTTNAFIRANISSISEKFAFLETKFPVGFDPRIDEFLYGDATQDNWLSFLEYLRTEFGPTKQQRASIFLDGFKRDGRKPSQYAASLDDKTKGVTIDEIKKEMLLREMPVDIRRMLQERIESLSFKDAAKIADSYFDAEGRPRHTNSQLGGVNEIAESLQNLTTEDNNDQEDVNAVTGRRFQKRNFPPRRQQGQPHNLPFQKPNTQQNFQTKPRQPNPNFTPAFPGEKRVHSGRPTVKPSKLCRWHTKFGDDAYTCEAGCDRFPTMNAGKATAGRQA